MVKRSMGMSVMRNIHSSLSDQGLPLSWMVWRDALAIPHLSGLSLCRKRQDARSWPRLKYELPPDVYSQLSDLLYSS